MSSFVHLHTHSNYSIGRAVAQVHQLVERAAQCGMPAIALTDNNSMAGFQELIESAQKVGIRPILGCELDILPSDHGAYQGHTHRLVLLVETEQGYRNLTALISQAHARRAQAPPHVSFRQFERHCQGLIALSGSRRGELYYWLREHKSAETKNYLNRLAGAVGQENLFFEILEYPHPRTQRIMDQILELSRFLNIPAVATQNVHFLDPRDMPAYCALVQNPRLLAPHWPPEEAEMPTRHFTTIAEMQKRFGYTPALLEQSLRIAERCEFRFPRRRALMPVPDFERGEDPSSVLWDSAIEGASVLYGGLSDSLKQRIAEEFADMGSAGGRRTDLAGYMLMLREITDSMQKQGVSRGVGRGAIVASVIAYALGITKVDPIRYGLQYMPLRPDPMRLPAFEIDVSSRGMEATLDFLRGWLGSDHIASVGRRVDWSRLRLFQHLSRWAGLAPVSLRRFPASAVAHALSPAVQSAGASGKPKRHAGYESDAPWDEDMEAPTEESSGRAAWTGDPRIPRGISFARHETLACITYTLHPCPHDFEADRAHYAVSKEPIEASLAVMTTAEGERIAQGEAPMIDRLQMPRVQFTSFSQLNVLEAAQEFIRQEEDARFAFCDVALNDEATFRLLSMGLTNGIAPLHSITAKSVLRSTEPKSIGDLLKVSAVAARRRTGGPREEEAEETPERAIAALPDCTLSYWCAYLKAHYPISFMAAMLTHAMAERGKNVQRARFEILLRETRRMEIETLGPDINLSSYAFTQERRKIRTGLMVVQGMGVRTFSEIEEVRRGQPFSSLADFCQRTDQRRVPHSIIVSLIKAGVFDGLAPNRARLLIDLERALKNARLHSSRSFGSGDGSGSAPPGGQLQLFGSAAFDEIDEPDFRNDRDDEAYPELTPRDIMRYEQQAVGYSITYDLLDYYDEIMEAMGCISPFRLPTRPDGAAVYVAGFVDHTERDGPLIDAETDMVLDLEGYVVKVPPAVREIATRVANDRGPILVEGLVRQYTKAERFLEARHIYLLEEVAARANEVTELRLDLAQLDKRDLRAIRATLKAFAGASRVAIEGGEAFSWWARRGIAGSHVFFCPPLYESLRRHLPEACILPLDSKGDRVAL